MSNQPFQQTTTITEYVNPPAPSDYSQSPITSLDLPQRLESALYRSGCRTVGDVLAKTPYAIKALPNVGQKSLDHLRISLKARGLSLRDDRIEAKPSQIEEKLAQTEETTPPQDGAPVTESQGDSALQCLPQSRRYNRVLPIYAIMRLDAYRMGDELARSPMDLLVWEIWGSTIIPVDPPPKALVDFQRQNDGFFQDGHLHLFIRVRSFFGLVDNLIPIMDTKVCCNPKLPMWYQVEEVVKQVLFN
jgi:hypothetical protein